MSLPEEDSAPLGQPDPVFIHSRREAILIFLVWLAAFAWTVPYCYRHGYQPISDPSELKLVFGFPSWVFWGIVVPWLIADVLTVCLCFGIIREDDLTPTPEQQEELADHLGKGAAE